MTKSAGGFDAEVHILTIATGIQSNPPAVKRQGITVDPPKVIEIRVVEKEIATLGKEQRKATQVHLTIVHFRFGEIGVGGDRQSQTRSRIEGQIKARISVGAFGFAFVVLVTHHPVGAEGPLGRNFHISKSAETCVILEGGP